MIVRPAEVAPAPPIERHAPGMDIPAELPQRFMEILGEAAKMAIDPNNYHAALRDWVEKGAESEYAMDPETVIQRSRPRSAQVSLGHAHFELATHLETGGHHEAAIKHFREAHRLVPDSWTFRRQAWSLEGGVEGPLNRFWQGPSDEAPGAWPYEGDWLEDVRKVGAENYNDPWTP
jgi:hypothetical protein